MVRNWLTLACLSLFLAPAVNLRADESPVGRDEHKLVTEPDRDPAGYRALVKQAMEGHLGGMGFILTRRVDHVEHMRAHAESLARLASYQSLLYPPACATAATSELIWVEEDAFAAAMTDTAAKSDAVLVAIDSGNQHLVLNALTQLGDSCESCHDRYRITRKR